MNRGTTEELPEDVGIAGGRPEPRLPQPLVGRMGLIWVGGGCLPRRSHHARRGIKVLGSSLIPAPLRYVLQGCCRLLRTLATSSWIMDFPVTFVARICHKRLRLATPLLPEKFVRRTSVQQL